MAYRIAAIDAHKKMLAVVVADVEGQGEYQFERRKFGASPDPLRVLAEWLVQQEIEEVVMESTAVLEAGMGSAGTVLEACAAAAGRGQQDVRQTAFVPGQIPTAGRADERTISRTPNG